MLVINDEFRNHFFGSVHDDEDINASHPSVETMAKSTTRSKSDMANLKEDYSHQSKQQRIISIWHESSASIPILLVLSVIIFSIMGYHTFSVNRDIIGIGGHASDQSTLSVLDMLHTQESYLSLHRFLYDLVQDNDYEHQDISFMDRCRYTKAALGFIACFFVYDALFSYWKSRRILQ